MKQEIIGPKIKEFRKKRNLTQDELAEALGYSGKSVISHIEKGDADMTYEKILLLLRTYALDANELFEVKKIDSLLDDYKNMSKHDKVVVYIHGLEGSCDEVEDFSYLGDDYDLKGLDYTDGNPWELKETIRGEFARLTKSYNEIIVIANSIGAFYTYEYLSDFDIKHAFFISPIADMFKLVFDLMMQYGITARELENKRIIELDNGQTLSYDFYKHVSNYNDNWNVPTDLLYGEHDELVYIENIADFLAAHPNAKLTIKRDSEHYFHTVEEKQFIKKWILSVITTFNNNRKINKESLLKRIEENELEDDPDKEM